MPFTVLDVLLHQPLYPAALINEECCAGGIAMALHHFIDHLLQHRSIDCLADDLHMHCACSESLVTPCRYQRMSCDALSYKSHW